MTPQHRRDPLTRKTQEAHAECRKRRYKKLERDDTLTNEIKEKFEKLKEGRVNREEFEMMVGEAQSRCFLKLENEKEFYKKLKGDDTLTNEIKEAFKKFLIEEGVIDKESYMVLVSEAQSRYRGRVRVDMCR